MSDQQIQDLFNKYCEDSASPRELAAFKEKITGMSDNDIHRMLATEWTNMQEADLSLSTSGSAKVLNGILSRGSVEEAPVIKGRFRWLRYSVAAAAILILAVSGWWLMTNKNENHGAVAHKQNDDVLPGTERAILTLADGSVIVLDSASNGSLARQEGASVVKLKNGQLVYQGIESGKATENDPVQYNVITTPRGGQYQIVLPDGTRVWLNADSYIRFPTTFKGAYRDVEIKGEAYLEIAKNKSQPFIAKVRNTRVEVLGTSFNVMAYEDETVTKTTLFEGSVKVQEGSMSERLMPGEQSVADINNIRKISLGAESLEQVIAWKNNEFRFNNDNLESVMRQISRWYNVNVVYEGADKDLEFGGVVSRKENVSVVLKKLELTGSKVRFRIEGKTIYVK